MSRSRRKTNIIANLLCGTEKEYKRLAARKERRIVRQQINIGDEPLESQKTFGNPWEWGKDGKQFFDPEKYPKGMRK